MSDLAIIFFACFGASLATSVFWRLWTQRASSQRLLNEDRSKLANTENLVFHDNGDTL